MLRPDLGCICLRLLVKLLAVLLEPGVDELEVLLHHSVVHHLVVVATITARGQHHHSTRINFIASTHDLGTQDLGLGLFALGLFGL